MVTLFPYLPFKSHRITEQLCFGLFVHVLVIYVYVHVRLT